MGANKRGELIVYPSPDGQTKLDVRLEEETVRLTQAMMADLFQVQPQNITMHLKNVYEEGELDLAATCKDFYKFSRGGSRTVLRQSKFYNPEADISFV